ncbi:MAG: hypothetical protein WC976_06275 [Caldisericia bacterium]
MEAEFSTIQNSYAEQYLKDKSFDWLNEAQKKYILENLGDIRVQDPMMYLSPKLAIHNNAEKHRKAIMGLVTDPEKVKNVVGKYR